jgi:hypothetical protein
MYDAIVIQSLRIEPGSKQVGYIKAAETPSSTIQMPIIVLNGADKGPVLSITAGIHGCEYTGIAALGRLYRNLSPKDLKGAVIAAQIVNVPSFENRTPYVCPIDNLNIGGLFPGRKDGTVGHQLVYTAFTEIVSRGNYYIELHGGDMGEEHIDVAYFSNTGDKDLDKKSEMLARNCLAEWVWQSHSAGPGSSTAAAAGKGIPKITYEIGDLARLEERRIKQCHDGILNVMKHLGMLDGQVAESKARLLDQRIMVRAQRGGLFLPKVKQGDIVSKEQLLGEVLDLSGTAVEELLSPAKGVVLQVFPTSAVHSGAALVGVATFK